MITGETLTGTHVQYSYILSSYINNYYIGKSKFLSSIIILITIYLLGDKCHIKYFMVSPTPSFKSFTKILEISFYSYSYR